MSRSPLFKALASLLITALLLVLAELGAAGWERLAHGTRWRDGQPQGLYQRDGQGRTVLVPGARLPGLVHEVNINSLGFRGPELLESKPGNGLRIWCLGGSTTFDIYAPDDERAWPGRLQALLAEALPDRQVEVINAGIPGERMQGNARDLQRLGPTVRPDFVVLYSGANDLRQAFLEPAPGTPPPPIPLEARINLASFRLLQRLVASTGFAGATEHSRALDQPQSERLQASLRELVTLSEQLGARPVLASHALRPQLGQEGWQARLAAGEMAPLMGLSPQAAVDAFEAYNRLVEQEARSRNLPFVDVRAAVPGDRRYWGDATHFAAPGSELAARAVAQGLLPLIEPQLGQE